MTAIGRAPPTQPATIMSAPVSPCKRAAPTRSFLVAWFLLSLPLFQACLAWLLALPGREAENFPTGRACFATIAHLVVQKGEYHARP